MSVGLGRWGRAVQTQVVFRQLRWKELVATDRECKGPRRGVFVSTEREKKVGRPRRPPQDILIGDFLRGGSGRGGIPHPGERYNVCPRWCRDTRTVTRVRHHLLCLRDDQNPRNNRVTVQWRHAGCRASPYRHPGCHANVVPPG